jgi:hypothetical protein
MYWWYPWRFYCNNPIIKILSRFHKNCKIYKERITDYNNKFETCKDNGIISYDLVNCTEKCENGFFLNDTIKAFKCSTDIRFKFCNKESKENQQCVISDYDKGYYHKNDENKNIEPYFICYKQPEDYYLEYQIYKLCYPIVNFAFHQEMKIIIIHWM